MLDFGRSAPLLLGLQYTEPDGLDQIAGRDKVDYT